MNLPIDIPSGGPGIIVDLFAGGGGASKGIRMALGRDPDLAINHDPEAVAMHRENHPGCRHLIEDVWSVDPSWATQGRPVDLLWASPDCTHHSKAKGSAPNRDDKRRSLACVITDKWVPACWPETIIMENVEEFKSWGPVDHCGRVIESAKGDTFRWFVKRLRGYGYRVEYRELRACDYGAPTIRKRLFLIAKRNNAKIIWPEPTHGPGRPEPYRTAADCIDWSLPCPSIFDRKRPLADATLRRIAKGIMRYVVQAERPFIVNLTHGGRLENIDDPIRTITCANRGEKALVVPVLEAHYGTKGGKDLRAHSCTEPVRTVSTENRFGLVTAFLAKHYGGVVGHGVEQPLGAVTTVDHHSVVAASLVRQFGHSDAAAADAPVGTITAGGGGKTLLSAAHLVKLRGTCRDGQPLDAPTPTITAGGNHAALVHASLVKLAEEGVLKSTIGSVPVFSGCPEFQHAALVTAFMLKYYGADQDPRLESPLHTITTKDRFGLVTVHVEGEPYYIADIGLRMLQPRELFRAQGFPDSYVIDHAGGKPLTKTAQVRMCGNSVSPYNAAALVRANCNSAAIRRAEGF
ncbi:MAG: DNA cytosine methyltransferase [Desulfomicrobium sp.]|nr:DNA cytosine methyltransferase [Desulfomicrobium sp.]